MRRIRLFLLVLLCLMGGLPGLAVPVAGEAPPATTASRMRVSKDAAHKPRALQTEITHITLGSGQKVDLVAAVHLGEAEYYAGLNRRFKQYDAVLYELVVGGSSPKGPIEIPKDGESASGLSQVQLTLCRLLGLKFQLYAIDYSAPNFRHADLTYDEFQRAMEKSGESPATLLMKILQIAISTSGTVDEHELDDVDLLTILTRGPTPKEQRALRRMFAACFPEVERLTAEIQGTALIAGRNKRAVQVLERELKAGRRTIAVFYGAGHMADMEQRVLQLAGARVTGREWLDAWHLEEPTRHH